MPDIKTLIQNIKIKNNLSRNDLAKILGVSSATVKRWEYGTMPSFDNIKKLQNMSDSCNSRHIKAPKAYAADIKNAYGVKPADSVDSASKAVLSEKITADNF